MLIAQKLPLGGRENFLQGGGYPLLWPYHCKAIYAFGASPLGESIFEPPGMLEVGVPGANVLDSSSVGLDDIPGAFRGDKIFLDD